VLLMPAWCLQPLLHQSQLLLLLHDSTAIEV
jgi:hypothetical protein